MESIRQFYCLLKKKQMTLARTHKRDTAQGKEEMCLSLEDQNPSKTSEKMGYFDRVMVSLHIL